MRDTVSIKESSSHEAAFVPWPLLAGSLGFLTSQPSLPVAPVAPMVNKGGKGHLPHYTLKRGGK